MNFKFDTGFWPEDFLNDYFAVKYQSSRQRIQWYFANDRLQVFRNLKKRAEQQHQFNDAGLNPANGHGAFERELERKGIPVEKYQLPTTTSVTRVHEAVLLRREELEKKSAKLLAAERLRLKVDMPSEWFDETDGPLNSNFLTRYAQQSFTTDVRTLPRTPLLHSQLNQQ